MTKLLHVLWRIKKMFLFRNTFTNGALWISIFYYMMAYFFAPADMEVTLGGLWLFGGILLATELYSWYKQSQGGVY